MERYLRFVVYKLIGELKCFLELFLSLFAYLYIFGRDIELEMLIKRLVNLRELYGP